MDEVCRWLRLKHYRLRTEQACTGWIRRFILANDKRHPRVEVQRDFLSGFAQHLVALQIPDPFSIMRVNPLPESFQLQHPQNRQFIIHFLAQPQAVGGGRRDLDARLLVRAE